MAVTTIDNRWGNQVDQLYRKYETINQVFVVKDKNDTPVDLTGAVIELLVKAKETDDDTDPLVKLLVGTGLTISGTDNEQIEVDTEMILEAGTYCYHIKVALANGPTFLPYYGAFTVDEK